jgi:hypothetical protein
MPVGGGSGPRARPRFGRRASTGGGVPRHAPDRSVERSKFLSRPRATMPYMSLQSREGLRRPKGRNERAIPGNGSYADLAQDSLNSLTNRGPELLNPPPTPGRFGLPPRRPRTCRGNARSSCMTGSRGFASVRCWGIRLFKPLHSMARVGALPDLSHARPTGARVVLALPAVLHTPNSSRVSLFL